MKRSVQMGWLGVLVLALVVDRPARAAVTLSAPTLQITGPVSISGALTLVPDPCCNADFYDWTFTPLAAGSVVNVVRPGLQLNLADLGLNIGMYEVSVFGILGPDTSPPTVTQVSFVSATLDGLKTYPNPWRSDRDQDVGIRFEHLTAGATIKIFDMAGYWVRTLSPTTDSISWDRRNDKGDEVASGLYLYFITDQQGSKARGKLTIIK
jgi:hypothetical protein